MAAIRLATADDTEAILAIYAPIVRDTAISFELKSPTPAQMQERIEHTLAVLPWLVADSLEGVTGYAYASRHRERPAYQWAVDVSVYVRADARGRGVARALYSTLFGILEDLSYFTALAGIALPNAASVALHEAMGFAPIGIYRRVGYKLGAWHDVGWWQRSLQPYVDDPTPPLTMCDYRGTASLRKRLSGSPPPK